MARRPGSKTRPYASGINANHQLLSGDPGRWSGDCVVGGISCWGTGTAPNGSSVGTPGYDTGDVCSHGTSVVSIIRGSDQLGAELRGITRITTDSWKVFEIVKGKCTFLNDSIARAVQKAIASFNGLLSMSLGNRNGPVSTLSILADNAFDVGIAVVAAAGNWACNTDGTGRGIIATGLDDRDCTAPKTGIEPDWRTVASPANAFKAIAVGARDLRGNCLDNVVYKAPASDICAYSSRGPVVQSAATPNPRYKPDILGYTNVETAFTVNTTFPIPPTFRFGGTSAAAPTIAGLAMLYHNWMENAVPATFTFNCPVLRGPNTNPITAPPTSRQVCPGHVYAYLLNSGSNVTQDEGAGWLGMTGPFSNLNIEGAGLPVAPTNGWAGWGEWEVSHNQTANIPLNIPVGACNLSATIWWPENFFNPHSNLNLIIRSPAGFPGLVGNSRPSVWERQFFPGQLPSGGWVITIIGSHVSVTSQPFYFAWSYNTGAGCP